MCDLKDAKRHVALAVKFDEQGNKKKAREHYVEACSIYVLQYQLISDEHLLEHAREYFHKAQQVNGIIDVKEYSKEELARLTLKEAHAHQRHDNVLEQITELIN